MMIDIYIIYNKGTKIDLILPRGRVIKNGF